MLARWLLPTLLAAACMVRADSPLPEFAATLVAVDTLLHGDTVTAQFPFVNTSHDTLVVDEIRSPCGCLTAVDERSLYAPGDSGAILATFSSSGQRFGGTYETAVTFRLCRDTAREQTVTTILSLVVPIRHEVRFAPPVLTGVHTNPREPSVLTGTVRNESDSPVTIVAIAADSSSPLEVLTRQLPITLQSSQALPFVVALPPGARTDTNGNVYSRISAVTENTRYTEHSCEVYLYLD